MIQVQTGKPYTDYGLLLKYCDTCVRYMYMCNEFCPVTEANNTCKLKKLI